jgi:hypothetical protein
MGQSYSAKSAPRLTGAAPLDTTVEGRLDLMPNAQREPNRNPDGLRSATVMADGGWRMADGGWRMADGDMVHPVRAEFEYSMPAMKHLTSAR